MQPTSALLAGAAYRAIADRLSLYGTILASASLLVLSTHVHAGFERVRHRVVTTPQSVSGPLLSIPLPGLNALAGSPTAVIVRARSESDPISVGVALDEGRPFASLALAAGEIERFDLAVRLPERPPRALTLTATQGASWRLEYLEIANVHGHSSGLLDFVIVPRDVKEFPAVPAWLLVIIGIGLVVAQPRAAWPSLPGRRRMHRGVSVLILLFFAAVLLAPAISPYRVLLSGGTAAILVAVLFLESIVTMARQPVWRSVRARWVYRRLPHAAAIGLVAVALAQHYRAESGFTAFIRFGEHFRARALPELSDVPRVVHEGSGYDGQFYAQLALDPLLRSDGIERALDSPTYRSRRILLSWIAWLLGAGDPARIVNAYAWLNVLSWGALAVLLLHWCPPGSARASAAWLGCVLSDGVLTSIWFALPDGPSLLLIALGIRALEAGRARAAPAILGVAALARETNILSAVILLPRRITHEHLRQAAWSLAIAGTPLVLWTGYVLTLDLPGRAMGTRNFDLPLWAYAQKGMAIAAGLQAEGWSPGVRVSLMAFIALTTQALVLVTSRRWHDAWWRTGAVYVALMLVAGEAVWEGSPGAVTRLLLPMTVAFNLVALRLRWFWPAWVLGNANLLHGLNLIGASTVVPALGWLHSFA